MSQVQDVAARLASRPDQSLYLTGNLACRSCQCDGVEIPLQGNPLTDLLGAPRFLNDPGTADTGVSFGGSPAVDMGATEYVPPDCKSASNRTMVAVKRIDPSRRIFRDNRVRFDQLDLIVQAGDLIGQTLRQNCAMTFWRQTTGNN